MGNQLKGIRVNIKGITLGIVDEDGTISCFGIAKGVGVECIVAAELIMVVLVDVDDVAVGFGEGTVALVVEAVALDAGT